MQKFSNFLLMEGDKLAFFKGMMGDPASAALIFADWLTEHDQPELAEAIRIVFQGRVGDYTARDQLIKILNQESQRFRSLGYIIAHNGTVFLPGSLEPKINKILTNPRSKDESDSINLNFDGHGLYGYKWSKGSKPTQVNPDLITKEETIETVIFSYMYVIVSNLIKPSIYGDNKYGTSGYYNTDFDTYKRMETATVYNSLLRLNQLLDSKKKGHLEQLKQEIQKLEKMPEIKDSQHDLSDILETTLENYTGDTPLRRRILGVLVKHAGDEQLSDLIHSAGYNDEERFCPVISQISAKLKYQELASIFQQNPVTNPVFIVNIYEVEYNWVGEEGNQEPESEDPVHEVENEPCDLGTTLRYLEDFEEHEEGGTWVTSRNQDYRTGAETDRTMHIGLDNGDREIDSDTLDILYKAAHRR